MLRYRKLGPGAEEGGGAGGLSPAQVRLLCSVSLAVLAILLIAALTVVLTLILSAKQTHF